MKRILEWFGIIWKLKQEKQESSTVKQRQKTIHILEKQLNTLEESHENEDNGVNIEDINNIKTEIESTYEEKPTWAKIKGKVGSRRGKTQNIFLV